MVNTKRAFYVVVLPIVLMVFLWSYQRSAGDLLSSFRLAITVGALLSGVLVLYRMHLEKKNSGLSEEEFLLQQAGGAHALLDESVTVRAIGWLCIIVPTALFLFTLIATKSFRIPVITLLVSLPICTPCAFACFRFASKRRRIAQQAGAKIW